ncbi:ABC transporter ATP-binding protein [Pseudoruegeria sp. HB172150]|uniref:ABC transporter ATP-binding protein n=1 Tax=Pseudoruegeria sp. HB172150 TaxID=2721164 RepID=UPI0015529405|nr:ABC transporter ATP-binding protein [Pseudoruegeria sp. HB172150]
MNNSAGAILTAQDLWAGYGGAPVVRGVDFAVAPGRLTAILGPNGCGKSTLLRTLAGLQKAERGEVTLGGRPIARMGSKALARVVSVLAQNSVAPERLTVGDLVRQGRYPHRGLFSMWSSSDQAAVDEALEMTGTAHLADRAMETLSGGQRQRAWIAMTLAQQGEILLLDEPTTFLDPAHQLEVLGLIRALSEAGKTVVTVLHDLNLAAEFAGEVVLMREGEIRARGTPREALTEATLAQVFGLSALVVTNPETGAPVCLPRAPQ